MADKEPVNEQDFLKMQQDAIRRVRDMQARARRTLAEDGIPLAPPAPPETPLPAAQPPQPDTRPRATAPDPVHTAAAQEPPDMPPHPPAPRPTLASMRPAAAPAYARLGTLRPSMREYSIEPPDPAPQAAPQPPAPGLPNPLGALFHLSLDSEQLMLMGILYMLYRDHGDPALMLALGYLLLG